MTDITLLDTTLRDGNQSNWGATGLDTAMMLQIAPVMDRIGFEGIDFTTSTHMAVAVRFKKEDPWERPGRRLGRSRVAGYRCLFHRPADRRFHRSRQLYLYRLTQAIRSGHS